ncbi:endogenous retrovirus group K member 10 Pro protein-like [Sagmatias obliquidens]|uniref:endogenous retrovirus group K member 10 Pro protein-like n=1 Tax=Sagmatias obliquidens TaxID=3371155 RepID=UPI000F445572|nr:endogenous retrovirus group K member 10 Pro protein-like [Lagenorhynchus obliquidens]XP_026956272.1 endogenous retrovirus group K member 10 Pro protein-like [Lagenorhynchus obliquidens]
MMTLWIEGRKFVGLVDTGADRSIITQQDWPKAWPLQQSSQTLQGLGYAKTPNLSLKLLTWKFEKHSGCFQPFVVDGLPFNLWGRNVQSQMKLTLTNDYSEAAQKIMLKQGYVPDRGLGRRLQGIQSPLELIQKRDRAGLGFS